MRLNCLPGRQQGGFERHLSDLQIDLAVQPTLYTQTYNSTLPAQANMLKMGNSSFVIGRKITYMS